MNEILQQKIKNAARECDYQYEREELAFISGGKYALQNQWILVKEDLPKYNEVVIAIEYQPELSWEDQRIIFAHRSKNPDVWRDKNDFCIYPPTIMKITHWMPVPSLEGGEG